MKNQIKNANDLPDFATMTAAEEADFWENNDIDLDVFETGDEVEAEIDELLGITDADKHD